MSYSLRNVSGLTFMCIALTMLLHSADAVTNVGLLRNGNANSLNKQVQQRQLSWTSPEYAALFQEDTRALFRTLLDGSSLSLSMSMPSDPPSDVPSDVPSAAPTVSEDEIAVPTASIEPVTSLPTSSPIGGGGGGGGGLTSAPAPTATAPTAAPTEGQINSNTGNVNNKSAESASSKGGLPGVAVAFITIGCVGAVAAALFVFSKKRGGAASSGMSTTSSGAGGDEHSANGSTV